MIDITFKSSSRLQQIKTSSHMVRASHWPTCFRSVLSISRNDPTTSVHQNCARPPPPLKPNKPKKIAYCSVNTALEPEELLIDNMKPETICNVKLFFILWLRLNLVQKILSTNSTNLILTGKFSENVNCIESQITHLLLQEKNIFRLFCQSL